MPTKHPQEHAYSTADTDEILTRVISDRLELLAAAKEAARIIAGDRDDWKELPAYKVLWQAIEKVERP